MDVFIKTTSAILIAIVINLVLAKQGKELSILLTLVVCAMVSTIALEYLRDVIAFLEGIAHIGRLNHDVFLVLLKCVGIALLAEIAGAVCTDSGNGALGKVLHLLSSTVILWLSLPLFTELMNLIENVLGAV